MNALSYIKDEPWALGGCRMSLGTSLDMKAAQLPGSTPAQVGQVDRRDLETLAELGILNSEIIHELDNAFGVIQSGLGLLNVILTEDSKIDQQHLQKIVASLVESSDLVGRIFKSVKTLASPAREEVDSHSLRNILECASILLRERVRVRDIKLDLKSFQDDQIECSQVQMLRFFLNMINNACDAIQGLDEKWIRVTSELKGDKIWIRVIDSGPGIAPELREKIMQPGFSTKEAGKGTGLGLSICQRVAEFHHGTLSIDSSCPNTCFLLILPKKQ